MEGRVSIPYRLFSSPKTTLQLRSLFPGNANRSRNTTTPYSGMWELDLSLRFCYYTWKERAYGYEIQGFGYHSDAVLVNPDDTNATRKETLSIFEEVLCKL